jgi:hypothetical protein
MVKSDAVTIVSIIPFSAILYVFRKVSRVVCGSGKSLQSIILKSFSEKSRQVLSYVFDTGSRQIYNTDRT